MMRKSGAIFVFIALILIVSCFVSASYVKRVYGTCEENGKRTLAGEVSGIESSRQGWWDYVHHSDSQIDLWYNAKDAPDYKMDNWNANVKPQGFPSGGPSGGIFKDKFKETFASGTINNPESEIKTDCNGEGCPSSETIEGFNGKYVSGNGFLAYGCLDQACNYDIDKWRAIKFTKFCNFLDNSLTYSKAGRFNALSGADSVNCIGSLKYTEVYDKLPKDCSAEYDLGGYNLYADNRKATFGQGELWFNINSKMKISSDLKENGKIIMTGNFKMLDIGSLSLIKINQLKQEKFYGKFKLNTADGKTIDLMEVFLEPILKDPGITNGELIISSEKKDEQNEQWFVIVKGKMYQKYFHWPFFDKQSYNEKLGPFKREQIKEFADKFKDIFNSIVSEVKIEEVSGTYPVMKSGKKWDIGDKKWNEFVISEFNKDSKTEKTLYLEKSSEHPGTFKQIEYTPPAWDISELLKVVRTLSGSSDGKAKTGSQSVWIARSNYFFEGIAYSFSPPVEFNDDVEIAFNISENETLLHYPGTILDNCNYDVLNSTLEYVLNEGANISFEEISYNIPQGAVPVNPIYRLPVLLLNISKINITSCNHCANNIINENETGIDCGGECKPCEESCFDNIQNQNEAGIDCGGECLLTDENESCGFDFNRDCNITECSMPACSYNSDCDGKYCIKNICMNELVNSDMDYLIGEWKSGNLSLYSSLLSSKLFVNPIAGISFNGI